MTNKKRILLIIVAIVRRLCSVRRWTCHSFRHQAPLLLGVVGDALLEPFWPEVPRGAFDAFGAAWTDGAVRRVYGTECWDCALVFNSYYHFR